MLLKRIPAMTSERLRSAKSSHSAKSPKGSSTLFSSDDEKQNGVPVPRVITGDSRRNKKRNKRRSPTTVAPADRSASSYSSGPLQTLRPGKKPTSIQSKWLGDGFPNFVKREVESVNNFLRYDSHNYNRRACETVQPD